MKRFLVALGLLLGTCGYAAAQAPCIGVGGVNTVAQVGVVCQQESSVATYAATGVAIVPAASATDIACIAGAASKVIRIQRIRISGSAGTLVNVPVFIMKRASKDTGGTPADGTGVPVAYALDSGNAASVAVLNAYKANPTIPDSSPGIITAGVLPLSLTGTTLGDRGLLFDFGDMITSQKPTLRAAAEQVCVNLGAATVSSGVINVAFLWTEAAQ